MPESNLDPQTNFEVRRTSIKTWLTPETMSPLGKELFEIAKEIEESDEPVFDEHEIEQELKRQRGGHDSDEQ